MSRIGIVGIGWVGSSIAAAVLQQGLASELLLNDRRTEIAEGEAMDFAHGALFYPAASVRAAALAEMRQADVVVIAAGRGGRPEESRLDLLRDNVRVIEAIARELRGFGGVLVVVTNPVDVLTEVARRAADLPPERVLGSGTVLDSMRLRVELAAHLRVHPQSVHAQVLGEHGDSEVVNWSGAHCGGRPLRAWPKWSEATERMLAERVRCAAYEIIRRKGATNHAIGMATAAILAAIVNDERRVLAVSRLQTGTAGIDGVPLSLPAVVGANGAELVLEPQLDRGEARALARSADIIRARLEEAVGSVAG